MRIAVSRAPGAERVVTPLELFFDLVYVFAIGQLSHHLLEHVDLRTGAETVILALAVVYAWYMVAWGANWLEPDRLPVRLMLVVLMFASLLMSVAIADAFGDRAWLFVTGYLLIQLGRSGFLIVALRGRTLGEHFVNDFVWEVLIGVLWVAGAIADGDARLVLWGIAVVATYTGVSTLHWLPGRGHRIDLAHTDVAGEHLIERFRLFFIIALGETVLTMGTAFTDEPFELERLLALAIGFTGTVALWWCYFQRAEPIGVEMVEDADDAGALGWLGTLTLTLIVLALIGIAVADEMAIAHPGDDATLGFTILTFGGPALFLLAQVYFLYKAVGHVPRSRPLALAALAILAVSTASLTLIVSIAAASAVLVAVAIADTVGEGESDAQQDGVRARRCPPLATSMDGAPRARISPRPTTTHAPHLGSGTGGGARRSRPLARSVRRAPSSGSTWPHRCWRRPAPGPSARGCATSSSGSPTRASPDSPTVVDAWLRVRRLLRPGHGRVRRRDVAARAPGGSWRSRLGPGSLRAGEQDFWETVGSSSRRCTRRSTRGTRSPHRTRSTVCSSAPGSRTRPSRSPPASRNSSGRTISGMSSAAAIARPSRLSEQREALHDRVLQASAPATLRTYVVFGTIVALAAIAGELVDDLPHAAQEHLVLERRDALQAAFLAGHPGRVVAHRIQVLLRAFEETERDHLRRVVLAAQVIAAHETVVPVVRRPRLAKGIAHAWLEPANGEHAQHLGWKSNARGNSTARGAANMLDAVRRR